MKLNPIQILIFSLAIISLLVAGAEGGPQQTEKDTPDQMTVPLSLEGNRTFIDVTLQRADGSKRSARFLIDTGGGAFLITEALARDLGLRWGEPEREEGHEVAPLTVLPKASVGTMPLELDPHRVAVAIGSARILPPVAPGHEDGMLPGHVLAHFHVVVDYPNGRLTLARPGALKPTGDALPMPVSKRSGFPRTEMEVDGMTYGFLLDTGASFTIVSEALLKSWAAKHPDWPRSPGAVGEAATLGGSTLETMSVPNARWGANRLGEFGVTSQKEGTFEHWMSSMMTSPVVGSLAGNVLKRFRVELDYPNEKLYLSTPSGP